MKHLLFFMFLLTGCVTHPNLYPGAQYLGVQYVPDPLGEDDEYDTDPLIRDDAFDCVTFVETVLAQNNVQKLNKIRYKNGEIDFKNRNHFMETDWLTNNSNLVENVSSKYTHVAVRRITIDKKSWFKRIHGIDVDVMPVTTDLEYVPYSNISEIKPTEPMIVLFVVGKSKIHDKIGTDLAVVHTGFLLPNGKLRHASSAIGRVTDVDFAEYVQSRRANQNNLGVALIKIK